LIVNPRAVPDLVITPLFDDSVELVHCLGPRKDAAELLAERPLVYVPELAQSQAILADLSKRKLDPQRVLPCGSLELVKSLVLDEVGVGILPRRVAQHGTKKRLYSLAPALPAHRDRIALVRRYDVAQTAAVRLVIDELTAHGKQL